MCNIETYFQINEAFETSLSRMTSRIVSFSYHITLNILTSKIAAKILSKLNYDLN